MFACCVSCCLCVYRECGSTSTRGVHVQVHEYGMVGGACASEGVSVSHRGMEI